MPTGGARPRPSVRPPRAPKVPLSATTAWPSWSIPVPDTRLLFRQVLPAPEGNSRQVLLSGRGRQTFVGPLRDATTTPKKKPGPDNYAASWFNTPTWDPLSFFPPPPWDPRGFLGVWSTYLGPRWPAGRPGRSNLRLRRCPTRAWAWVTRGIGSVVLRTTNPLGVTPGEVRRGR